MLRINLDFKINKNYFYLPILYLLSFVLDSDAARFRFGIDFSFLFLIAVVFNYWFVYKNPIKDMRWYSWWIYLLLIPGIVMTLVSDGDYWHMLACLLALLLPFALEPFIPEKDISIKVGSVLTFVISAMLLFLYSQFGFLERWNPNCIGYLIFLGICSAVIILSETNNLFVWAVYIVEAILLIGTESRNVAGAVLVTIVLLLFKKILKTKKAYRATYIIALCYPAVFPKIAGALKGTKFYNTLVDISREIFEKNQGLLSGRDEIFEGAERLISSSVFKNIFGHGRTMVSFYAAHNDYYLLRYTFGLIGTGLIAAMLVIFFEKAYKLISAGDNITFGIFCIMISVLFQQATEGWFVASFLIALMPFVYMAVVIKRYRIFARSENEISKKNLDLD